MSGINPLDAKPDEVYMGSTCGERRIMVRRNPEGPYPWHVLGGGVRSDDEVEGLVRLEPAPAVSRADIDRALINVTSNAMNYPTPSQMLGKDAGPLRKKCVDAVWALLSGADPAVHVVRESDVAAVEVTYGGRGWEARGLGYGDSDAKTMRSHVRRHLKDAAGCEAVARAIEAGADVDPVEAKARELADVMNQAIADERIEWHQAPAAVDALASRLAAHVLGQGDRHVDQ